MPMRSVVLEGARLSQPDGLWLDDAFPQIREGAGLYGLFVELETPQPRTDLEASGCVVELHSSLHLTRFWPAKLSKEGHSPRRGALPIVLDAFQTSSLVIVNGHTEGIRPTLKSTAQQRSGKVLSAPLSIPMVEPQSAAEIPIPPTFFEEIIPQECSYGLVRVAGLELEGVLPAGVAAFVLYRDASNNHPVSVCGL